MDWVNKYLINAKNAFEWMEWKETERSIMTNVLEWMKNKKLTIIEATALHCAFKSNREQEFDLVSHQSTKLLAFVRPKSVRWMNRWVCVCVCVWYHKQRAESKQAKQQLRMAQYSGQLWHWADDCVRNQKETKNIYTPLTGYKSE